jgi:hypothetical protein
MKRALLAVSVLVLCCAVAQSLRAACTCCYKDETIGSICKICVFLQNGRWAKCTQDFPISFCWPDPDGQGCTDTVPTCPGWMYQYADNLDCQDDVNRLANGPCSIEMSVEILNGVPCQ